MREAYKNTNYKAKREVITTLFSTLKTPSRKNASKAFTTCLKIEKNQTCPPIQQLSIN